MNGSEIAQPSIAQSTTDHDLLIKLNANVENMTTTLHSYTSSTSVTLQDHESRIRLLETANSEIKGGQKSQKNQITIVAVVGGLMGTILAIIQFIRG